MVFIIGFFILVVILGALSGGKSFGETISGGLGCLVMIVVLFFVIAAIGG